MSLLNRRGFLTTAIAGVAGALMVKSYDFGVSENDEPIAPVSDLEAILLSNHHDVDAKILRSIAEDYASINESVPRAALGAASAGVSYELMKHLKSQKETDSIKGVFHKVSLATFASAFYSMVGKFTFSEAPSSNDLQGQITSKYGSLKQEQAEGIVITLQGHFDKKIQNPIIYPTFAAVLTSNLIEEKLDKMDINVP